MPQIEGWATLHSPSAGAGELVLTAPVIEALDDPITRAKYYAEAEDLAGNLLWEFGLCNIRGTVIVRRDVINSSAGVGTAVEFPNTGVRLSISDPVVAAVQPGGGGDGSGDVVGPASSTNNVLAQFSGATGKLLKALGLTGLLKVTAGVPAVAEANTDYATPAAVAEKADAASVAAALAGKSNTGHTHTKGEVGLGNVDNTSDANKPVSTAQAASINAKQDGSPKLSALVALTWAADRFAYFTDTATAALATLTSFGRQLLALADVDALKALLGYTSATPSGTGDMLVYTGSATEFQTPAQVRDVLGVTNLVTIPYSAVPANGTIKWVLRMRGTGTFDSLTHELASGSVTVNVQINGTSITGLSAVAPTSTKTTTNATAANTWADGDEVRVTFSGASSPGELAMTLNGTRTS